MEKRQFRHHSDSQFIARTMWLKGTKNGSWFYKKVILNVFFK